MEIIIRSKYLPSGNNKSMRLLSIVFAFLIWGQPILGQTKDSTNYLINRLYLKIKSSRYVQSKYIGCYGYLSETYQNVDSLKAAIGLESFTDYFNDSSVNLKYYAFIEILAVDDNLAFEKLKSISQNFDSINFDFAGQFRGEISLKELLIWEYLSYIKAKYYLGGNCLYHGRVYLFDKKNKRVWRQKKKKTYNFLTKNGIPKEWIENNYH